MEYGNIRSTTSIFWYKAHGLWYSLRCCDRRGFKGIKRFRKMFLISDIKKKTATWAQYTACTVQSPTALTSGAHNLKSDVIFVKDLILRGESVTWPLKKHTKKAQKPPKNQTKTMKIKLAWKSHFIQSAEHTMDYSPFRQTAYSLAQVTRA